MIADGVLPENYNYNDVPLLTGENPINWLGSCLDGSQSLFYFVPQDSHSQTGLTNLAPPGNFINSTHVMRNGSMMNIHELSNHGEQRVRDFKRYQLHIFFIPMPGHDWKLDIGLRRE